LAPVLSAEERTHYRQLFAMIDAEQWGEVETLLAARPDGVLTQLARAEYYTHANSPKISA
ncbi:MAG: lytic transglycosylase domain-containing protein, partial [Erythrobacteraceae bacterium]